MKTAKTPAARKYVHVSDASTTLGISVNHVYNLVNAGALTAIRIPGTGRKPAVRICVESLRRLEETYRTQV